MDYESSWLQMTSQRRLHLRKYSCGEDSACLMIHGFGEGAYVWHHLVPQLTRSTVWAVDLQGHGDSDRDAAGRYSVTAHVEDVERIIAELRCQRLVLIGHSMGAEIAIRVAAANPVIARVVLVDFGLAVSDAARQQARGHFCEQFQRYPSRAAFVDWLMESRPLLAANIAAVVARDALRPLPGNGFEMKCDPALCRDENRLTTDDRDLAGLLRKIRCPVMLVRGAGSAIFPGASAWMTLACLNDARLTVVPRAGHSVMLDNPVGFAAAVTEFIDRGKAAHLEHIYC